MSLRIYNTMTRKKEPFVPAVPGRVGLYACGVTVYDFSHIGHARAMVVFDVIQRYFKYSGYDVQFVRNHTDIDDKIINRANREKVAFNVISERFIDEFEKDMAALGIEPPTHSPKATDHIPEMIAMIRTLVDKGHAYAVDGDVYFDVSSFPEYGKLSGKQTADLLSGARIAVDDRKKSPLDFALWKQSKEGEPFWESPWGKGRPGWHIECSVMSRKYLGDGFDIHGGGMDLVFPHHENEIAQSECATGKPFVRYWMHNGFVNINSEKMSKSLQNFLTIREALKQWHPEVIRLFLLSSHYRSPVDFSDQNLAEAKTGLDRFYGVLRDIHHEPFVSETASAPDGLLKELDGFSEKFRSAMDDDLNTAAALGHLYAVVRGLNALFDRCRKEPSVKVSRELIAKAADIFSCAGSVFGLFADEPNHYFEKQKQTGIESKGIRPDEIELLIEQRRTARSEKNWAEADRIRNLLQEKGIVLKDTPQGTEWRSL